MASPRGDNFPDKQVIPASESALILLAPCSLNRHEPRPSLFGLVCTLRSSRSSCGCRLRVKRYRFGAHRKPLNVRFAPTQLSDMPPTAEVKIRVLASAAMGLRGFAIALRRPRIKPRCCGPSPRTQRLESPSQPTNRRRCARSTIAAPRTDALKRRWTPRSYPDPFREPGFDRAATG